MQTDRLEPLADFIECSDPGWSDRYLEWVSALPPEVVEAAESPPVLQAPKALHNYVERHRADIERIIRQQYSPLGPSPATSRRPKPAVEKAQLDEIHEAAVRQCLTVEEQVTLEELSEADARHYRQYRSARRSHAVLLRRVRRILSRQICDLEACRRRLEEEADPEICQWTEPLVERVIKGYQELHFGVGRARSLDDLLGVSVQGPLSEVKSARSRLTERAHAARAKYVTAMEAERITGLNRGRFPKMAERDAIRMTYTDRGRVYHREDVIRVVKEMRTKPKGGHGDWASDAPSQEEQERVREAHRRRA